MNNESQPTILPLNSVNASFPGCKYIAKSYNCQYNMTISPESIRFLYNNLYNSNKPMQ
ncbi:hypothetical protein GS03_01409 [Flavobacterium sangjuense]|uniref:Uncharacterized protein n=1 Tax=Flavobacterium sangjuense TaxID=2518177 RepID=A0A4P7PSL5_9FLAO|nr:hypothetical protein GS03_01409 [Flavobacterium sangjuense]